MNVTEKFDACVQRNVPRLSASLSAVSSSFCAVDCIITHPRTRYATEMGRQLFGQCLSPNLHGGVTLPTHLELAVETAKNV